MTVLFASQILCRQNCNYQRKKIGCIIWYYISIVYAILRWIRCIMQVIYSKIFLFCMIMKYFSTALRLYMGRATSTRNRNSRVFSSSSQIHTRSKVMKPKGFDGLSSIYSFPDVIEAKSGLPSSNKSFTVLGIESSCDDTGVAIVRSDGVILSNIVYSQYEIHQKFGGIVPMLAQNAHMDNIDKALQRALSEANLTGIQDVDAIAVTQGPGLEVCLRVGLKKAQVSITKISLTCNDRCHSMALINVGVSTTVR